MSGKRGGARGERTLVRENSSSKCPKLECLGPNCKTVAKADGGNWADQGEDDRGRPHPVGALCGECGVFAVRGLQITPIALVKLVKDCGKNSL